jgi:hypothetical protein
MNRIITILISALITLGTGLYSLQAMKNGLHAENFDWYRLMSVNLFTSCNYYFCESVLIPFAANILNLNRSFAEFTSFNFVISYCLILATSFTALSYLGKLGGLVLMVYVLISIHLNLFFSSPNFPDLLFIFLFLIGYLVIPKNKSLGLILFIASFTAHATLAITVFLFTWLYILATKDDDQSRELLIAIPKALIAGFIICKFYLAMFQLEHNESRLSYLVDNFQKILNTSALLTTPIYQTIPILGCLYIIAILTWQKNFQLLAWLLVALCLGLLLQYISLDEIRIFRTFFTATSSVLLIDALYSKKELKLSQISFK